MKKLIIILAFFFPLFSFAYFENNLYHGIIGSNDVEKLQEFLTSEELYDGPITGNFFSLTLKAVQSFQTREGITPVSGYFGPLTRNKANAFLALQGIKETITDESGYQVSPVITPPKTNDDVVAKLNEQIGLLQQQIVSLKQQNEVLLQQYNLLEQQSKVLGQIQENTANEIKSEIKRTIYIDPEISCINDPDFGKVCPIKVKYFENNQPTGTWITISSSKSTFIGKGSMAKSCLADVSGNGYPTHNPLTCPTDTYQTGVAEFYFFAPNDNLEIINPDSYLPDRYLTATIMASANGESESVTFRTKYPD